MSHLKHAASPAEDDMEQLASDLSIAVWNRIAQLPQFGNLHPKDFPQVYETVYSEIKRVWGKHPGDGIH